MLIHWNSFIIGFFIYIFMIYYMINGCRVPNGTLWLHFHINMTGTSAMCSVRDIPIITKSVQNVNQQRRNELNLPERRYCCTAEKERYFYFKTLDQTHII
jgi:hypothetical protein